MGAATAQHHPWNIGYKETCHVAQTGCSGRLGNGSGVPVKSNHADLQVASRDAASPPKRSGVLTSSRTNPL